ncbi:glycosyltransferase family 32 protein [Cyathus striatus]|nr:glycosyltransferase family 32 protein [Cyathus striatus]
MSRKDRDRLPMYASSQSASSPRLRSLSSATHPFQTYKSPSPTPPSSPTRISIRHRSWVNPRSILRSRLSFRRPRSLYEWLKWSALSVFLILLIGLYLYEPHIEISLYDRSWVHRELKPVQPLAGCFDPSRVSFRYNVSQAVYGPKKIEVQAGMQMRMGMDCYNFAGTIPRPDRTRIWGARRKPGYERKQFHTYWRTDLVSFGPRQEWMLKSFFATQDLANTRLILWSNGDLSTNRILRHYLRAFPDAFALKIVNIPELARGTALDGSPLLDMKDKKAWVDGDLIRLLLLWNYGGVWIDMDSLLTRDLEPLLEHEFVTQWDCYDKKYTPFNGALMHFLPSSPYLCEAFYIMTNSPPPRSGSVDWGSTLYFKLWRSLVESSIPPFKILPYCFGDGRSCRLDNRLPDPFEPDNSKGLWTLGMGLEEGGGLDQTLGKVFGVHLHNQWEKEYPKGGWVERLLLKRYDEALREMEDEDDW